VFQQDPELWDPDGDTMVYFGHCYKEAAFRICSSVLQKTGSAVFLNLLRSGHRHQEGNGAAVGIDALPQRSTAFDSRDTLSDASSSVLSKPSFDAQNGTKKVRGKRSLSNLSFSTGSHDDDGDPSVQFHIYLPPPPKSSRAAAIQFHLTTRNVFALLLNKSPVGLEFGQMLKDLQWRLTAYMPPETNCAKLIVRYLMSKKLHNVANNPAIAAGLLAWSEGPSVRWREGWREAFVHCCGMYPRLRELPEFERISAVTRELLRVAHKELQARIRAAEDRLLTFKFDDIWPPQREKCHPARSGFDSFRRFLRQHYEKAYKSWHTRVAQEHCNESWLTRQLVKNLQEDHGALYDFLVDRDMTWVPGCKVMQKKGLQSTGVEIDDAPIMNLLTAFDNKHNYMPIIHPYPLLPPSVPVEDEGDDDWNASRKSLGVFGSKGQRARQKRVTQAYAGANNAGIIAAAVRQNALVEAFRKYEKGDQSKHMDPHDARKGRWMLLYCTLQALAGISVDTPHLFFTDVPYFLNPRLTNTPPWADAGRHPAGGKTVIGVFDEASRLSSHCWTAPKRWGQGANPTPGQIDHQVVITNEIDGFSLQSGRPSIATGKAAEVEFEVKTVACIFDDFNSDNEADIDREGDLENVGMPGFRAPLRGRQQPDDQSRAPSVPWKTSSRVAGRDLGRSDYAPPDEW